MSGEKILVVEDNFNMREAVREILSAEGYEVSTAVTGRQGLEAALNGNPDLIFTDLSMPQMNGLEMLKELRRKGYTTPGVIMTAYGSEEIVVEALRFGVRDYLSKPFQIQEVLAVAESALREMRIAREREQLNRELLAAESTRITIVTLAHYLNNYLTILATGLGLLDETLRQKYPDERLLRIIRSGMESAISIQAVINVLRKTTNYPLIQYNTFTPMLNIEDALRQEVEKLNQQISKSP